MSKHFDLIVIGTGPSASRIAKRCCESLKVAVIEAREVGGECALRGCNPKKVFVRAAELMDWVQRADGKLITAGTAKLDWPQIVSFKNTFTDPIPQKSQDSFESKGIAVFKGRARFTSSNELTVGDDILSADKIAICTGAQPVKLGVSGEELVTDSGQFMDLDQLPESIVFIGGGYISFEFAHVANRLGRKVTIIDRNSRPLAGFDGDLVNRLVEHSRSIGIKVITDASVTSIRQCPNKLLRVEAERNGTSVQVEAGLVVHGAGRVPSVDGLNLEAANVEYSDSGITVNEYLQSNSNPAIFAAGDVVASDQAMLTPVANQQGYTVAKNILDTVKHGPEYGPVPKVVFTIPSLASIGMTEERANEEGIDVQIIHEDQSQSTSVKKVCASCSEYKLIVDKSSNAILGAHLLGPEAAEMINVFAVAIKGGMTAKDLKSVLMAFPTFTADIRSMV